LAIGVAGLVLASLFTAFTQPATPSGRLADFQFLLVLLPSLPLFLLGLPFLFLATRRRPERRPWAFLLWGLLWPLAAIVGGWCFAFTGYERALPAAGAVGGLLFLALALLLPSPRSLPWRSLQTVGVLGIMGTILLLAGFSKASPGHAQEASLRLPDREGAPTDGGTPDVILISIDTLRADTLLDSSIPTPTLDELRSRSRWSPFGLAAAPSSLPSHVTMMLGTSPLINGCYNNLGLLPQGPETLAEAFAEAGYRTFGVAANPLLQEANGFARGFETLINVGITRDRRTGAKTLIRRAKHDTWLQLFPRHNFVNLAAYWIASRRFHPPSHRLTPLVESVARPLLADAQRSSTPFFFFLHFMAPHSPYDAPPPFQGALSGQLPMPPAFTDAGLSSLDGSFQVGEALAAGDQDAKAAKAQLLARYGEELMTVDDALGHILADVEASGRPTIVLLTSDHGEHFGEHGRMRHGSTVFAPVLRVPFLLSGPGIPAGNFTTVPHHADIPFTLLQAAGLSLAHFGEGRNLLAPPQEEQPYVALRSHSLGVFDQGFKLILQWDAALGKGSPLTPEHMYRVQLGVSEFQEEEDLLGQAAFAEIQDRLTALAEEARDRAAAVELRAFESADLEELAALGYAFDAEGKEIDD